MLPSELVEDNLLQLFRHFASAHDSGEIRELPGVSIASSGIGFHMFNGAFLSAPVQDVSSDLKNRIAGAGDHFDGRGLRWAFWVCEDKLESAIRNRVRSVFHDYGLGLASRHPGMLAGRLLPPARPLPALEIRRVNDRELRVAFCHVNAVVFEIPFRSCLEVYDLEPLWSGPFSGYVGYANETPVTVAATMATEQAVGVYSVATLLDYRKKGCAEAIVRHALREAHKKWGIERSILQSTATAIPLYYQMGYKTVTHFSVYSSPG
jgi:GNAT superfamily N-acetyltransferase